MSQHALHPFRVAAAAGLIWAAGYSLCAAAVALAPAQTAAAFSYVMHIDLTGLSRAITWGSYFGGLIVSTLVIATYAGAIGGLYNLLNRCCCKADKCGHDEGAHRHACCEAQKSPAAAA